MLLQSAISRVQSRENLVQIWIRLFRSFFALSSNNPAKKKSQALNCQFHMKTSTWIGLLCEVAGFKQIFLNFAFSAELNWIILRVGYWLGWKDQHQSAQLCLWLPGWLCTSYCFSLCSVPFLYNKELTFLVLFPLNLRGAACDTRASSGKHRGRWAGKPWSLLGPLGALVMGTNNRSSIRTPHDNFHPILTLLGDKKKGKLMFTVPARKLKFVMGF